MPDTQSISIRTHPDVLQLSRQKIHGEVDAMKHAISLMHSQLNSLAPVSFLPIEILAECFKILADVHPPSGRQDLGWIALTHVCHYWRDLALNMPSLWTAPAFSLGSRWVSEMIIRSKDRPLTLMHSKLAYEGSALQSSRLAIAGAEDVINILREHLYRVQHMELDRSFPSTSIVTVLSTLCRPAPLLRALKIYKTGSERPISIPSNFLAGNAPLLCSLELRHVEDDWMVPAIRSLYHLVVCGSKASRSMDPFLDLLERNPEFRTLHIISVFTPVVAPPSGTRFIELPNLQELIFRDSISNCVIFLNFFRHNPVALAVTLLPAPAEVPEDDHNTLYAAISAKVASRHLPFLVLSVCVRNHNPEGTIIFETSRRIRWIGDHPDFAPFATQAPSFALELHPPTSISADRITCIANAVQKLPFNDVEMLIVKNITKDLRVWAPFSQLPSVKYLEFSRRPFEALMMLSRKSNRTESGVYTVSSFPELTYLRLVSINFTRYDGPKKLQDLLLSTLCIRTRTICRVQWVCLTACTISEEIIEKIRKIVPKVVVEAADV